MPVVLRPVRILDRPAVLRPVPHVMYQPPAQPQPPAPAVAPAPPPATPALCILEYYQLTTAAGDMGYSKTPVETINILPTSKRTLFVRTKRVVSQSSAVSSSVLESKDSKVANDLSQSIRTSAEQAQQKDRADWKLDASFHGEVDVGFTGGSADADAHASTSSNAVRDSYRNAVDEAVSQQVAKTEEYRQQKTETVNSADARTEEGESVETFELNNPNPFSMTYMLCPMLTERLTALSLVNVKLGFFNARTRSFEASPLSGVDALLDRVITDPDNRGKLRDAIMQQLALVFDYRDEPRQFIEKRELPASSAGAAGRDFHRVIPELSTDVTIRRPDGSKKTLSVPGIAIKADYHVLSLPKVGLVRGVSAA